VTVPFGARAACVREKAITGSRIFGPVLKMVGEFEASVKKHPLIAMRTPDPYTPPDWK
jgi:arylsulfatase